MAKETKKPTTRKKMKKQSTKDDIADLKKKIKLQKNALNKIIKTYSK